MKVTIMKSRFYVLCCFVLSLSLSAPVYASVSYEKRSEVKQFIDEMVVEHGFDRADLASKFAGAKKLDSVLEAIARPAEKRLTWAQYRPIFVTNKRSNKGKQFIQQHRKTLERAEKEFGVPVEIITAIIGVETYYGRQTGGYTVFDSLTTLGFDYPPRSKFFKSELKQFLLLSKEEDISVDDMTGSYAGAMGMPQFISSSYRNYAIDFDGDGKRDLWNSVPDVIGSVANYFAKHHWQEGKSVTYRVSVNDVSIVNEKNILKPYITVAQLKKQGVSLKNNSTYKNSQDDKVIDGSQMATLLKFEGKKGVEYWLGLQNFYTITRYNHSELYAMAVFQLSEKLKQ